MARQCGSLDENGCGVSIFTQLMTDCIFPNRPESYEILCALFLTLVEG